MAHHVIEQGNLFLRELFAATCKQGGYLTQHLGSPSRRPALQRNLDLMNYRLKLRHFGTLLERSEYA